MSKKNLKLLIESNKFIFFCNIIIFLFAYVVLAKINSNNKTVFIELKASERINYQISQFTESDFKKQNLKMFQKLKEIFEVKSHKLYLVDNTYNSNDESLGVSFAYEITPVLFSSKNFEINEEIVFSKLYDYFDLIYTQYQNELNKNLKILYGWREFYEKKSNIIEDSGVEDFLVLDLRKTKYEILKIEHLLDQINLFEELIHNKNNYILNIKENKTSIAFINILELIFVYLVVFNTIILILRKYKIKT